MVFALTDFGGATSSDTKAMIGVAINNIATIRRIEVRIDARRRTAFNPSTISIASSPGIFVLRI
jgi:hypothetical protein